LGTVSSGVFCRQVVIIVVDAAGPLKPETYLSNIKGSLFSHCRISGASREFEKYSFSSSVLEPIGRIKGPAVIPQVASYAVNKSVVI
jgi:hypothetical protein